MDHSEDFKRVNKRLDEVNEKLESITGGISALIDVCANEGSTITVPSTDMRKPFEDEVDSPPVLDAPLEGSSEDALRNEEASQPLGTPASLPAVVDALSEDEVRNQDEAVGSPAPLGSPDEIGKARSQDEETGGNI